MTIPKPHRRTIACILRAAEVSISLQTGLDVKLVAMESLYEMPAGIEVMLGIIAEALGMTMDDYYEGRKRQYVDLKCVAAMFIKKHYPEVSLEKIGELLGGLDHSSVLYSIRRGNDYLLTTESRFGTKYKLALNAVEKWING